MGAASQADLASLQLLARVVLGPDHDGLQHAVVLGRGEDMRQTSVKLFAREMVGHGLLSKKIQPKVTVPLAVFKG